jgi:hypothetical protein
MVKDRPTHAREQVVGYAGLLALCWVLVLASDAEAYIDPSAGGMLVQLLLAGTAGVAVLGKLFWTRIKRIFGAAETAPPDIKSPPDA